MNWYRKSEVSGGNRDPTYSILILHGHRLGYGRSRIDPGARYLGMSAIECEIFWAGRPQTSNHLQAIPELQLLDILGHEKSGTSSGAPKSLAVYGPGAISAIQPLSLVPALELNHPPKQRIVDHARGSGLHTQAQNPARISFPFRKRAIELQAAGTITECECGPRYEIGGKNQEMKVASLYRWPLTSSPPESPGTNVSGPVIFKVAGLSH